jgi:crotonobetainyl-CoA:carnitine CoA-transferase CaiB-like acyl-CoA transferase
MPRDLQPLAGVRVLDATSNIAGPFGAAVLADLGAQVTKLESPLADPSRSMVPLDGDRSAYFHIVNRNKTAITTDFKSLQGRAVFDQLLSESDVFLTNFLPDRLNALSLSPADLMAANPRLIYGNLTSYGAAGADASHPGYDATVQARTGVMYVTGESEGDPVRTGVSILDIGSGMWLAIGILAAIVERNESGLGCLIETSLYETGISWVSYHLTAYQLSEMPSVRSGTGHPTFAPYGNFPTLNGQICVGVGNDEIFAKFANAVGGRQWITDPRFAKNSGRVANKIELHALIISALSTADAKYWVTQLGKVGVPCDLVVPPEALFQDPQQLAVGMLLANPDLESKVKLIPGIPVTFNGKRPQITKSAPHRNI